MSSVVVLALALVLPSCRAMDKSLNSRMGVYASVDEARAEGAVQRGLVPQDMPPGSSDLRVAYLDDGTHWGVVTFPPSKGDALKALVGSEITSGDVHCGAPGRFEWWPHVLRDPIDLNTVRATGLHIYAGRGDRRTWAVNWNQGRAFYWKE